MLNTILILLLVLVVLWFCFSSKCQENFDSTRCMDLVQAINKYKLKLPENGWDVLKRLCNNCKGKYEKFNYGFDRKCTNYDSKTFKNYIS